VRRAHPFQVASVALAGAALAGCGGSGSGGPDPNAIATPAGITALPAGYPSSSLGAGTILVSASGESLSLGGFDWPPSSVSATAMVDGWQLTLYRYLTVIEEVDVWENPNLVPSDPSQHGPLVAHVHGPFVVDLHLGGPLGGKGGGGEQAEPFAQILARDDGSAFDPSVTYGFGFNTVAATPDVLNVNLSNMPGPDGKDDLDEYQNVMVPNGYSVLYEGVATYKGAAPGQPSCDAVTWGNGVTYDFTKLPTTLPFRMGFKTPTRYVNCQNGTDLPGSGVNGEEHPRGVQVSTTGSISAQVTVHMDHPFWESFAEDSSVHWDQIAAQYVGATDPVATVEDLQRVGLPGAKTTEPLNFTAFRDAAGTPIPWRSCDPAYYSPTGTKQMHFNPLRVAVTIGGDDPTTGLRNYYDFIQYTQATQGHLNSQGLCTIDRQYPAPPGGS
jgi:hypothetical protein